MIADIARIKIIKKDYGESLKKHDQFDYHIIAIMDNGSDDDIPGTYRNFSVALDAAKTLSARAGKQGGKKVLVCHTPETIVTDLTLAKEKLVKARRNDRMCRLKEKKRQKRIDNES